MRTSIRELRATIAGLEAARSPVVDEPDAATGWRVDGALAAVPAPAPAPAPVAIPGVGRASELAPTRDTGTRHLPVGEGLDAVLPWRGLRRGSTVAVAAGIGSTSLLLSLLAGPASAGAWCAIVGHDGLSAPAIAEAGLDADRLALIPDAGTVLGDVVSALLDGLDVVAVHAPRGLPTSIGRRLAAKARKVGGVLLPFGTPIGQVARADAILEPVASRWAGLGQGRGRLRGREIDVAGHAHGRLLGRTTLSYGAGVPHEMPVTSLAAARARRAAR
ncbi:hypothetical protein AB0I28_32225 [Phytomonospora sp. NPDC050363]|uniref:hypothetical protein n=1 Tax=Phytomonospora sp. NPDC050363 TaxID=3155642 RepID=UPI0034040237